MTAWTPTLQGASLSIDLFDHDHVRQGGLFALKPIYSRPNDRSGTAESRLNGPLHCCLRALECILATSRPRWIPLGMQQAVTAVVYADAFFQLGDKSFGMSDEPPCNWHRDRCHQYLNGWGYVVRTTSGVRYASGSIPPKLLALFSSTRALICILFGDHGASHSSTDMRGCTSSPLVGLLRQLCW